jgi:hypothetical protein
MSFNPIAGFHLDEITTVYYNEKYQACYIRNDTDYAVDGKTPSWYDDCMAIEALGTPEEHYAWCLENQPLIDGARRLKHWSE